KTGRVMVSENNINANGNDQAIACLTKQIAKLNINFAEKQPSTS
ncbi:37098_t:CDS:1, partial [Racocetra persica]